MPKKQVPAFANEDEEAQWWYAHREELDEYLELPSPEAEEVPLHLQLGLKRTEKPSTKPIQLRIPLRDLAVAKRLAKRKGIRYQTLMKMLLHEALEHEVTGRG